MLSGHVAENEHKTETWNSSCRTFLKTNVPQNSNLYSKTYLQACMYNSLPLDMTEGPMSKVEKIEDKLELFIKYGRRFGVPEVGGCSPYSCWI